MAQGTIFIKSVNQNNSTYYYKYVKLLKYLVEVRIKLLGLTQKDIRWDLVRELRFKFKNKSSPLSK